MLSIVRLVTEEREKEYMPELPEVETIRKGLEKYLIGKRALSIEIRYKKLFTGDPAALYEHTVESVIRFGKGLVINFDQGVSLAVHVKMTGQFIYREEATLQGFHPTLPTTADLPNSWTHVIFTFTDGSVLFYNDIRKFGWMKVVATESVKELSFFKALGPEPFVGLDYEHFVNITQHSLSPVKSLLINQQKISGVGNIYANEALYLAKINPSRQARSLTEVERKVLYEALLEVLRRGLAAGGATEANFVNVDGLPGGYQHQFLVYRKHGTTCSICGTLIERIVLAGRGTFWCPACQV